MLKISEQKQAVVGVLYGKDIYTALSSFAVIGSFFNIVGYDGA